MPIVKGFRRFQPNIVSSRQVATDLVSGSNVKQSGRSSFTTDKPIRKWVNQAVRREMLESFVKKYRAKNQGKFPSITRAQKEVGGSFYSVRKILQEMEYNARTSPVAVEEDKKLVKGDDALSSEMAVESSGSQITNGLNHSQDPPGSNFDKNIDVGNNNITRDYMHTKLATEIDEKPEQNLRDDNFAIKDSESKVKKQPDAIRSTMREVGKRENEDLEKTSLWGSLKSLANEFINIWKK